MRLRSSECSGEGPDPMPSAPALGRARTVAHALRERKLLRVRTILCLPNLLQFYICNLDSEKMCKAAEWRHFGIVRDERR